MAADHAVIFMYHRFGEENYPTTSVTIEQFESHLRAMQSGKYNIWPVDKITAAIKAGENLPDYTVGITIDDAAASVYTAAWPRFKRARIPFTLFVTTDDIDRGGTAYMNWDQLRELHKSGLVTIGNHSKSHPHFPVLSAQQIAQEIIASQRRFKQELGFEPDLFAYPYGEFNADSMRAVEKFAFRATFGQQSGVLHKAGGLNAIPRFSLNENYGSIDRFLTAARAMPLRISEIFPADSVLAENPPKIRIKFQSAQDIKGMNCYASGQDSVGMQINGGTADLTFAKPFGKGRVRINCTAMDAESNRWKWLGMQYIVPPSED